MLGKDDDRSSGMLVEEGCADLRAWAIGKFGGKHHDVRPLRGGGGDRVCAARGFDDDEPIGIRQLGPDSLSHEPVTLDDQNASRHLAQS